MHSEIRIRIERRELTDSQVQAAAQAAVDAAAQAVGAGNITKADYSLGNPKMPSIFPVEPQTEFGMAENAKPAPPVQAGNVGTTTTIEAGSPGRLPAKKLPRRKKQK